jgi:hypothetical protein
MLSNRTLFILIGLSTFCIKAGNARPFGDTLIEKESGCKLAPFGYELFESDHVNCDLMAIGIYLAIFVAVLCACFIT